MTMTALSHIYSNQNPHALQSEISNGLALAIYYCYRQLANLLSALAKYAVRKFAVQEES